MYNLRDELTYDSPVSPGDSQGSRKRLATGGVVTHEAQRNSLQRGCRRGRAPGLPFLPFVQSYGRRSSRTSEYCPSNRRRRLGGGGHSSHGAAPRLPDVLSRIFVPSYRPSSCRRRLRMRIGRGSSDQLSGTLSKSTEEREHWLVIAPIPPPESPEAWRCAIEGGAEGQGPSDGRMGCRNHD